MVEMVPHSVFHDAERFDGCQPVLGLALEFRLADEDREQRAGRCHHVIGGDHAGALVVGEFGVILQRAGERRAEALFMGAASAVGMVLQ